MTRQLAALGRQAADDLADAYAEQGAGALAQKASRQQQPPPLTPAQQAALTAILRQWRAGAWQELADGTWRYTAPAAQDGSRQTLMTLGLDDDEAMFDTVNQRAWDWAQDRAAEMVGMRRLRDGSLIENPDARWAITDSTRDMLRKIVADNIESGASVNQLRQAIQDSVAFAPRRALNIAATELHFATQSGAMIAARESGLTLTKVSSLSDLHPETDQCDDYADVGHVPLDYEYEPGMTSPPYHPACSCDLSFTRVLAQAAGATAEVQKWDESEVVRDEHGRFADQGGRKLRPASERAFSGEPRALTSQPSKLETGRLGEEIGLAYLRDTMGMSDAQPLNAARPNAPADMIGDDSIVEVKTGLVSNSLGAQKWRATIGQPSKTETEWLRTADPEERAASNREKSDAIMDRKESVVREESARRGIALKAYTVGIILDPDRRIADIHVFNGFHRSIRWRSEQTRAGYKGSYHY